MHTFFSVDGLQDGVRAGLEWHAAQAEVGADLDVPLPVGDRRLRLRRGVHCRHLRWQQLQALVRRRGDVWTCCRGWMLWLGERVGRSVKSPAAGVEWGRAACIWRHSCS